MYEKCFRSLEEAKEYRRKIKAGRITTFLSTDENGDIITIYCLRWKVLF